MNTANTLRPGEVTIGQVCTLDLVKSLQPRFAACG
jgi:hypothetical protein